MKRVYVAGPYSADNVITVLDNMREGMQAGKEVLLHDFAPFVPWFDYHFSLMLNRGQELTVNNYYTYSMAFLEVCDYMFVHRLGQSTGVKKEIKRANELEIPIFYDIFHMVQFDLGNDVSDLEITFFDKLLAERWGKKIVDEKLVRYCSIHGVIPEVEEICNGCHREFKGLGIY